MGKKKQMKIEDAEKEIISWVEKLTQSKAGGLKYRVNLIKIEHLICIRKGLLHLIDEGEL